jgi:hypothetical protein
MKTDLVLTIDEYLDECCVVPQRPSPPGRDARHVAITAEEQVDASVEAPGCRCDRWGHPCADCLKSLKAGNGQNVNALQENKMDYLIVLGVLSTMALYALLIERCLRDAEWR